MLSLRNLFFSGAVIRIDFYIIIGEVAAPGSCLRFAHLHIHNNSHHRAGKDFSGLLLAVIRGLAVLIYLNPSRAAFKEKLNRLRIEAGSAVAKRAENPSPVGVVAENGRLGQAGADDGFGQRPGVLFICRMDDFCLKQRGSPSPSPAIIFASVSFTS